MLIQRSALNFLDIACKATSKSWLAFKAIKSWLNKGASDATAADNNATLNKIDFKHDNFQIIKNIFFENLKQSSFIYFDQWK